MLKLLLLTLIFISSLFANKVIYLNYDETPSRVIKGEIFTATLKALSTVKNFDDIKYDFSNYSGLTILDDTPIREQKGKFFYDTFHMLVTGNSAKLPDVEASIVADQDYNTTKIDGQQLNVITLNPQNKYLSLLDTLRKHEVSYSHLHNAGNDAAYALLLAQTMHKKVTLNEQHKFY